MYIKAVEMGMERRGMRFQEEGRNWRYFGLLYPDDLVLCGNDEMFC